MTKVPQRFQKVSQKRPNGSKAPQKGCEKTTWLAFLKKFNVFSTIPSFCIVLASIWLLLVLIGSCWLLLAPIAFGVFFRCFFRSLQHKKDSKAGQAWPYELWRFMLLFAFYIVPQCWKRGRRYTLGTFTYAKNMLF